VWLVGVRVRKRKEKMDRWKDGKGRIEEDWVVGMEVRRGCCSSSSRTGSTHDHVAPVSVHYGLSTMYTTIKPVHDNGHDGLG
jgi:hypothetical protein